MKLTKKQMLSFFHRFLISCMVLCLFLTFFHKDIPQIRILLYCALVFLLAFAASGFLLKRKAEKWFYLAFFLIMGSIAMFWKGLPYLMRPILNETYCDYDNIQSDFFRDQKVMVIVPHQDDELNLAGGLIEQFTHSGNDVYLVFCTNGDIDGLAGHRYAEALDVSHTAGVPNDNVYFLGFGDTWKPLDHNGNQIDHIYNSPEEDLVWTSMLGEQATYGSYIKSCYMEVPYTRSTYLSSLVSIISEIKPDILYVNDYDSHIDHRAISLFFEEAMKEVLLQEPSYHPAVFKGLCYNTAWFAPSDFQDSINILSTEHAAPSCTPYFYWGNRVRFPVYNQGLSRFMSKTDSYILLSLYFTQYANLRASCITNGDKVFWERRTDSVLYDAEILLGDTETTLLNDFKLLDSSNLSGPTMDLGIVSVTEPIHVSLPTPQKITAIGLYDDPDETCNILSGYVLLNGETKVEFSALNPRGDVSYIDIPETAVSSFSLHITSYDGNMPGLTEIEAYEVKENLSLPSSYLMLMDEDGNFVYDYLIKEDTASTAFSLYSYPGSISMQDVTVELTGDPAWEYEILDDKLIVFTPDQKNIGKCMIHLQYGDISLKASLSKTSTWKWNLIRLCQVLDEDMSTNAYTHLSLDGQIRYLKEVLFTPDYPANYTSP